MAHPRPMGEVATPSNEREVREGMPEPVARDLRNPVTRGMKQWGYEPWYQYVQNLEDAVTDMACLPPSLEGKRFYFPTERGLEKRLGERLLELRKARG